MKAKKVSNFPSSFGFSGITSARFVLRSAAFLILVGLLATGFYVGSSASESSRENAAVTSSGTPAVDGFATRFGSFGLSPRVSRYASWPALPLAPLPVTVGTYASDCTTPKTVFTRGETVCAQVAGALPGWILIWSNANFVAVQTNPITTGNENISFTLSPIASLGDWRVIVFDPFGGDVYDVASFAVTAGDPAHRSVDAQVSKGQVSNETAAGSQVVFGVQVTNGGPDAAAVQLTDAVPANTTFVSFSQLSGPIFSCTNPMVGSSTGDSVCTIASLDRREVATFLGTYLVDAGVSSGTDISNTATVTIPVDVVDTNPFNDTSSASVPVVSTPCVLTCPDNITIPADAGQAGAVVTYSTPTSTGNCGQPSTGENGETIPVVSCNPASGSFFGAGTTTVICASQSGAVCSFQVTVENPGGLSISLNGANPLAVECGSDFTDPGASAVNGTGQSVPVVITYPSGFNPDAPAAGSYEVTYTATEGANSVSTTRTVNVADSKAPHVTLDGPTSITFSCGQPFVDPGVSASDSCDGLRLITDPLRIPAVTSSVEIRTSFDIGPPPDFAEINEVYAPVGSVNTNTPGKYRITYTATDSGGRSATAQRIVIVVPGGGTAPPMITLIGDPQMTVECGNFSDPGATATVPCVGAVPVTTSGTVDVRTPGTYTITYTACVEDSPGHCDPARTSSVERTVTVINVDNAPPTLTLNGVTPTMWPPNHKYHTFNVTDFVTSASDSCDSSVSVNSVYITQVTSDETENGNGDGDTLDDIVIASDCKSVQLRSERNGAGDGRVYTITFKVMDASGNFTVKTATVVVPRSQDGNPAVDSGPHYTLYSTCP